MDAAKRTNQPFLAELAVIQLHKVHHTTQNRCTKRIRLTSPSSHNQPQGFAVDLFTHLIVQLESGAHAADTVIAQLQTVIVECQPHPVGSSEKFFGRSIIARNLCSQLDARRQRGRMAVLLGKEQSFLLHGHTGVDLAENRQGSAAVTKDARFDGVLAIYYNLL